MAASSLVWWILVACLADGARGAESAASGRPRMRLLNLRRGGGLFGRKAAPASAPAKETMSEAEIGDMLAVVPVFCLADGEGRPVLMKSTTADDDAAPTQAFFTDADVARAHAARIAEASGNETLGLQIAALDLKQVLGLDAEDRKVAVFPDPRELHVARQLVLRGAGWVHVNATGGDALKRVDFADEAAVLAAVGGLDLGTLDLSGGGVPVFAIDAMNTTLGDGVRPWFLSFADLVRAYVNATAAPDAAAAGAGLERLLSDGGVTVATLDTLLADLRAPAAGAKRAFVLPPSSSLALLAQARADANATTTAAPPASPPPPADEAAALAAAAKSIDADSGGLFD